jgi:hypothetical protein
MSWRLSNDGQLPVRNSADPVEASLANWISKTRPRCVRSLASTTRPTAPNQQQLTVAEAHEFQEVLGDVIASTNACNRASNEVAPNLGFAGHHFEQSQAVPDIVRFWSVSNPVRLPGGHVFMKAIREEFVTATADGEKYFECSTSRNMFKKLDTGDLLLLVQTKCQQRVVAVGEVAHPAISRADNRAVLYDRLPRRLHNALNTYLDGAAAFDYVQFNKVYDLRDSNLKANDVLGYGGFRIDPRKNFGMGVLDVVETTESSIEKLRDFLDAQTVRWSMSRVDAVDVY